MSDEYQRRLSTAYAALDASDNPVTNSLQRELATLREALRLEREAHARTQAAWREQVKHHEEHHAELDAAIADAEHERKSRFVEVAGLSAAYETAIARAEKAEKRVAEVEAIYASLNANLRKMGSGAPFLPAVELAQTQHEADALRQRCEFLEAFVQKVHDVPPIGVEEIRLMQKEARALLPEREKTPQNAPNFPEREGKTDE